MKQLLMHGPMTVSVPIAKQVRRLLRSAAADLPRLQCKASQGTCDCHVRLMLSCYDLQLTAYRQATCVQCRQSSILV